GVDVKRANGNRRARRRREAGRTGEVPLVVRVDEALDDDQVLPGLRGRRSGGRCGGGRRGRRGFSGGRWRSCGGRGRRGGPPGAVFGRAQRTAKERRRRAHKRKDASMTPMEKNGEGLGEFFFVQ